LILSTIAPNSWSNVGGQGFIQYFPVGKALVVNQTQDVQEDIAALLDALRCLRDWEVAVEKASSGRLVPGGECRARPGITGSVLLTHRAEIERQTQDLLLSVQVAYWNLYAAQGALRANEEVLQLLHRLWSESFVRAQAGSEKSPPDLLA